MSRFHTDHPQELKPGTRVLFRDGDGEHEGTVNGAPWVYFDPGNGTEIQRGAQARVPVHADDGRTLDVAGGNIMDVRHPVAV